MLLRKGREEERRKVRIGLASPTVFNYMTFSSCNNDQRPGIFWHDTAVAHQKCRQSVAFCGRIPLMTTVPMTLLTSLIAKLIDTSFRPLDRYSRGLCTVSGVG